MHSWRTSFFAVVLCALTASAQGMDSNALILPRDRTLEVMLVDDQVGDGASHTLGWLYYDDLVSRGYIDPGDPADPNDDILIDVEGNGIPDFHEDLFNLNPDRGYIGEGTRCIPERIFFHQRASGEVLRLREPELLTGSCGSTASYASNMGPRRWEDMTGFPARPGGSVVGQRMRDSSGLFDALDYLRASAIPGLVDTYFSDRGAFPHIPNLLEPDDAQNGHMGLGHLVLLSTDDDDNSCPSSSIAECFTPRQASTGPGQPPSVGPVWDRSTTSDGIPDYKTSAFDPEGRVIPGRDVTASITEEDRRVSMGTVMGGREIVFFLVTYVEQIYGGTDTCFLPDTTPEGRLQCELWGHGDINVYFSKTLLNLDLNQLSSDVLASRSPRMDWLGGTAYARLASSQYGNVQITETDPLVARSHQQRTPHVLMLAPTEAPNTWVMGWEDMNAGGNRTFHDMVFLVRGVGTQPTATELSGSPNPVMEGEPVMLQATVTTLDGLPITEGTVAFHVDGEFRSSEGVDSSGVATTWLTFPPGEYSVVAVYEGLDGQYDSSQSSEYWQFVEAAGDGGMPDGGAPDGGRPDAGAPDAGAPDSGVRDAGAPDAGAPDAGAPDAGIPDAGAPDSGVPDAGAPDSGVPDAGAPDAGIPDSGVPDSGPVPNDGGPVTPQDGGATADDGGTLPDDDAGTPQADDAGMDAGEDSGTPPPPVDAGEDSGTDAGTGNEDDAGADAGTNGDEDAGPEGPDTSGPRDLTVTGWGCGATDAGSASVTLLALWLGLSFLRSRGRRLG